MIKRRPLLFFTVVIAIVMVFAVTASMAADCPAEFPPLSCKAGDYTVAIDTANPFPFFHTGRPYFDDNVSGYVYRYIITAKNSKELAKITQAKIGVLFECGISIDLAGGPQNADIFDPCEGDPHGWLFGVCNMQAINVHAQTLTQNTAEIYITTDSWSQTGLVSMVIRTGSGDLSCQGALVDGVQQGGIIGPGFDISDAVPASDVTIELPDNDYVVVKKNKKGCIDKFIDSSGTPIGWQYGNPPWIKDTDDPIDCGGLENRNCRGCFVNVPGRSFYYWDPILRRYVCYYPPGCK